MKPTIHCRKIAVTCYRFALSLALCGAIVPLQAQENNKFRAEANVDMVSQNVWRGTYLAGASIQPSITATKGNFELTVWGSTALRESEYEADAILSYSLGDFSVGLTDYWNGTINNRYSQDHLFELNVGYRFREIPLTVQWNTALDAWHSSYVEINYNKQVSEMEVGFSAGLTPWRNKMLETENFDFTKLAACLSKELQANSISIKTSCTLVYNPFSDQMFLVAGVGFSF